MENYAEGELGIKQKKEHEAREQALASLANRVHGKDPKTGAMSGGKTGDVNYGKVKIWNLSEKKFDWAWPVDAAERIVSGCATLDKPEETEPETEL